MRKTYKYRIYPIKEQVKKMEDILNICRVLYNDCLTERRDAWKTCRKSINFYDQARQLPKIKKFDVELASVYSQVIQDVLRRVDKAYINFYRRVKKGEKKPGFPRYKGKNRYNSFTYPQYSKSVVLKDGKLYLPKIGWVKIIFDRDIPKEATIKTCTITKDIDRWYACFNVEFPDASKKEIIESAIGVDVGLKNIVTLSTGEQIEPAKYLRVSEKKLVKSQKRLSRKKKGSKNRLKQKAKLGKIHRKIRNQRMDFNHKLSRKLVNDYDLIVFEDLKIKNMLQNHHLAESISDAGWNQLQTFTAYKAEEAGKIVEFVDPRGTSIECNVCGNRVEKTLKTRVHKCSECGLIEDRDVNAAKNILKRGYNCLPQGLREITPVEMFGGTSMNQEAPIRRGSS